MGYYITPDSDGNAVCATDPASYTSSNVVAGFSEINWLGQEDPGDSYLVCILNTYDNPNPDTPTPTPADTTGPTTTVPDTPTPTATLFDPCAYGCPVIVLPTSTPTHTPTPTQTSTPAPTVVQPTTTPTQAPTKTSTATPTVDTPTATATSTATQSPHTPPAETPLPPSTGAALGGGPGGASFLWSAIALFGLAGMMSFLALRGWRHAS